MIPVGTSAALVCKGLRSPLQSFMAWTACYPGDGAGCDYDTCVTDE